MITPEYLEQCPTRLVEIYEQAERDIIADMARKIKEYDFYSSATEWQAKKLQEMGLTYKEIQSRLAKASGKSKAEIVKLLKESGAKELKDDGVKPTQSTVDTLNAGLKKTMGTFDNLTMTTAVNGTRQISEALDRAYMQVSSGAFSQEIVIRNAISDLAKNGIEAYNYGKRKEYIDVIVRRAVRTGINQTVAKIALSNADKLGTDLVEVSAHSGARPTHAEWQGKVYSISGKTKGYKKLSEATGYGTVTGLCGANCRHTFYPFHEGDEPAYTEEELKSFDEPKYTYNGEKLTEYEATQRQRYIERQLRRWKREEAGMKAAGLSTDKAESKIKHWNDIQEDFLKQTGLKRQYGREEAYNIRNIQKEKSKKVEIPEDENKIFVNSDDEFDKLLQNETMSFRGYHSEDPMSDWGHAMFADKGVNAYFPETLEGLTSSGKHAFSVKKELLTDIEDLTDDIVKTWEEDAEEGTLYNYNFDDDLFELSEDELMEIFNPPDIVDDAGGYDSEEFLNWFRERIIEPRNIPGVNTYDGAIVFDKSIIKEIVPVIEKEKEVEKKTNVVEEISEETKAYRAFKAEMKEKYKDVWAEMTDAEMDKWERLEAKAHKNGGL